MEKPEKTSAPKALYTQIFQELRERIFSGELSAGTRLPTEFEMAQQYQISRGTVRQALNALENEGLLERVQGRGTFVRLPAPKREQKVKVSQTKSIGVILSLIGDELSLDILLGVEQAAKPRGYQISFAYAEENPEVFAQDIARLQETTSGLVIFPISDKSHDEAIARLAHDNFPFVLVDRYISDLDCDYVVSDNLGGGYRATEHLLILGHTRIGFAYSNAGGLLTSSVRDRWEGYRRALQEYSLPYDESLIYHNLPGRERMHEGFDEVFTRPDRPTAIFAVNDWTATGILRAAQRHGVRVPEDLALVGFDDVSYAMHLSVPLTTMAQQRTEMGARAGTLLLNRIENQLIGAPRHIELPTNLIIRQSCGARVRISNSTARERATG